MRFADHVDQVFKGETPFTLVKAALDRTAAIAKAQLVEFAPRLWLAADLVERASHLNFNF